MDGRGGGVCVRGLTRTGLVTKNRLAEDTCEVPLGNGRVPIDENLVPTRMDVHVARKKSDRLLLPRLLVGELCGMCLDTQLHVFWENMKVRIGFVRRIAFRMMGNSVTQLLQSILKYIRILHRLIRDNCLHVTWISDKTLTKVDRLEG